MIRETAETFGIITQENQFRGIPLTILSVTKYLFLCSFRICNAYLCRQVFLLEVSLIIAL